MPSPLKITINLLTWKIGGIHGIFFIYVLLQWPVAFWGSYGNCITFLRFTCNIQLSKLEWDLINWFIRLQASLKDLPWEFFQRYFLIFFFSLRMTFICFVIQGESFLWQVNVSCGIENINYKIISPVNQIDALFNQINTEMFIVSH